MLHSSEISWSKKNVSANKFFKVNDEIPCVITDIDKDKKKIENSQKLAKENPYEIFEKKYPVFSKLKCKISNIRELSIYMTIDGFEVDGFLHANDLSWSAKPEDEIKKYKKGDELEVMVSKSNLFKKNLIKQLEEESFDIFKNKKLNDVITVKSKATSLKKFCKPGEKGSMKY